MFNREKHREKLVEILKGIYADVELRTLLGFKGGTAAMLLYDLPRLSVDLDFDLLQPDKKQLVFDKLKSLLGRYGTVREAAEKWFTLYFLISYEKGMQTIKLDISKRPGLNSYQPQSYLGISMLAVARADMAAGKLSALLTRRKFAMRDVYDLWFFLESKWPINEMVLAEKTDLSMNKAIRLAIKKVRSIPKNQLLRGLGELLDNKQKAWVRDKLIAETLFQLRLYQDIYLRPRRKIV